MCTELSLPKEFLGKQDELLNQVNMLITSNHHHHRRWLFAIAWKDWLFASAGQVTRRFLWRSRTIGWIRLTSSSRHCQTCYVQVLGMLIVCKYWERWCFASAGQTARRVLWEAEHLAEPRQHVSPATRASRHCQPLWLPILPGQRSLPGW